MRHLLDILTEANISISKSKFWINVQSSKIIWLGGMDHHAHAIYNQPQTFGLAPEQVAHLDDHPAMRDAPEDENGEPDAGSRIIYMPELFWLVMQNGWVRGGMEGEHSDADREVLHPYGLYLEGKSLSDLARAARTISQEVSGDPEWPDPENDWTVDSLRLDVRAGPTGRTTAIHLSGERTEFFMRTGRIPSSMIGEAIIRESEAPKGVLTLYHGSKTPNIEKFEKRSGHRAAFFDVKEVKSHGIFFAQTANDAAGFGPYVNSYKVILNNPLIFGHDGIDGIHDPRRLEDFKYVLAALFTEEDGDWLGFRGMQDDYWMPKEGNPKGEDWMNYLLHPGGVDWEVLDHEVCVNRMVERGYDGTYLAEPHTETGRAIFVVDPNQATFIEQVRPEPDDDYEDVPESALLESPPGGDNFWVSADGVFHEVEFHHHAEFVAQAFDFELTDNRDQAYDLAFNHGWIRLSFEDGAFITFSTAVTSAAMRALIDYLKNEEFFFYAIEVDQVANTTLNSAKEAIAYLRRDWKNGRGALTEASERVPGRYGMLITVWRDLPKTALCNLAKKDDLRCISNEKHFWVWKATEEIHREVARSLGVETGKENYTYISGKDPKHIDVQEWRGNGPRYAILPPVYCYWGMTGDPILTRLGDYLTDLDDEKEEEDEE